MSFTKKRKLIIISSTYPFGLKETFLHNEVMFLSQYFDIEIFPILKTSDYSIPHFLPDNVTYNEAFLERNYFIRIFNGILNTSPIFPFLSDFLKIFGDKRSLRTKIVLWSLNLIKFRTLYSSKKFRCIRKDSSRLLYLYWGNIPVKLFKDFDKEIFVRIHGGEVDFDRHLGYIPTVNLNVVDRPRIHYLPISEKAAHNVLNIEKVKYTINRLGVYDKGLNPVQSSNESLRIVSCSNVIKLKRIKIIIEALFIVKNISVEWVHFGDGPLFAEIKQLSSTLPENISVNMMGRVKNDEILRYYLENHIDLFINVSETEGVPVSIMEALSFGIPCFATNVGGTGEIVNNNNGFLAKKDFNISDLSKFIENIKNLSLLHNYRQNARWTWENFCSAEINYKKLVDVFNGIKVDMNSDID